MWELLTAIHPRPTSMTCLGTLGSQITGSNLKIMTCIIFKIFVMLVEVKVRHAEGYELGGFLC